MAQKGKELIVAEKCRKRGTARRFKEKAIEPHKLTWFNTQKEAKYAPENWIDEGRLALEFPAIRTIYVSG
ncbi:hypothetical protein HAX54_013967, partial [Datura stramonium]|nr:hypothetical protein [Datura stramonium]